MGKKKTAKLIAPKLSAIPSKAIKQALDDLTVVEKLKPYVIDMGTYHETEGEDEKCHVCFAGAVIARAGNSVDSYITPENFPDKVAQRLYGLDAFRQGLICAGLEYFNVKKIPVICGTQEGEGTGISCITQYEENPKQFKKDMIELANNLQALGL